MIRGFNFEKQFNNILDSFNIDRYCKKYQKNKIGLSHEAESSLLTYDFPGNIRELENAIQRAVTLAENDVITSQHLPVSISQIHTPDGSTTRFSTLTEAKRHAAEQRPSASSFANVYKQQMDMFVMQLKWLGSMPAIFTKS